MASQDSSRPVQQCWNDPSSQATAENHPEPSQSIAESLASVPSSHSSVTQSGIDSTFLSSSVSGSVSLSESAPSVVQTSQDRVPESSSIHSPGKASSTVHPANVSAGDSAKQQRSLDDLEDIQSRIEQKRLEHEHQRVMQRKVFEHHMLLLEMQQRQEERNLLQQRQSRPDTAASRDPAQQTPHTLNNLAAVSAPTTPPNEAAVLGHAQRRNDTDDVINSLDHMTLASRALHHLTPQESANLSVPNVNKPSQATAQRAISRSGSEPQIASTNTNPSPSVPSQSVGHPATRNNANRQVSAPGDSTLAATNVEADGFAPAFNERFLFDDELDSQDSAFVKRYNLQADDDKFPILISRDSFPEALSTSSQALDLAPLSQAAALKTPRSNTKSPKISEWPAFGGGGGEAAVKQKSQDQLDALSSQQRRHSERNSPARSHTAINTNNALTNSAPRPTGAFPLPSPSPLMSQNDRASPAVNTGFHGSSRHTAPVSPTPALAASQLEQSRVSSGSRFANHLGHSSNELNLRTPSPAASGLSGAARGGGLSHPDLSLKPPAVTASAVAANLRDSAFPSFNLGAFSSASTGSDSPNRFGPYSPGAFDPSDAGGRGSRPNSGFFDAFNPTATGTSLPPVFAADQFSMTLDDSVGASPPLGTKHSRKGELDAATRLEDLQGEIFALCKDQHGCRFLQKKLEEGLPNHRDMIFAETFNHFAELMTDPFGNYLCQKMLEYCTDEQRNLIVEAVASELVTISLNMHGTRAVQKTIDFLSTSRQIHSIIVALSMNVVTLIKDLNGNHVIQKCLNRLNSDDNQFIYNAVAAHCIEVATHRHGCCVLQRCIDHASDKQRIQLVAEITYHALALVQDPFGNYVVQYVLDLSDPRFTDAVIRQFVGHVSLLSVQKFSSNVIEKCIRVSEPSLRKLLVEELLNRTKLEKLLRDSFANYVVQTSLDYSDPVQRMRLVECIRPILPMIRNTPYGKRIQSKLQRDNLDLGPPNGVPFSLLQAAHQQQLQAMAVMANRQPSGTQDFMGMNAFAQAAMQQHHQQQHQQQQQQPSPPQQQQQHHHHHQPPQGTRHHAVQQHLPPPPQLHHMYSGNHSGLPQGPSAHHSHGAGAGGGGLLGSAHHNHAPPNFGLHNGFGFNGSVPPPPMGMPGGPSGFSGNLNAGFGPY